MKQKQLIETRIAPATNYLSTRVRVRGPKGTKFYPYTYEVDDEARHAAELYAGMVLGEEVVEEVDAPHVPGGVRYFTVTVTPSKSEVVRAYTEANNIPHIDQKLVCQLEEFVPSWVTPALDDMRNYFEVVRKMEVALLSLLHGSPKP